MPFPGEIITGELVSAAGLNSLPGGVLGYAQVTSNQGSITSEVDLTGLSVTVDVAATRRIRVSAHALWTSDTTNDGVGMEIKESTTRLQALRGIIALGGESVTLHGATVLTPSSGSHTYKLTGLRVSGSGTTQMTASATVPAFILVEDLGPA